MQLFEVPNLDACNDAEHLREYQKIFAVLADYAEAKWKAIEYRNAGIIPTALKYEKTCDKLYNSLPEWARW